jgi:hypothetical protein
MDIYDAITDGHAVASQLTKNLHAVSHRHWACSSEAGPGTTPPLPALSSSTNRFLSSPDLPFGRINRSGYGTELSKPGIEEFINKNLICLANAPSLVA